MSPESIKAVNTIIKNNETVEAIYLLLKLYNGNEISKLPSNFISNGFASKTE